MNMGTLIMQLRDVETGVGVAGTVRFASLSTKPQNAQFRERSTDKNGKLVLSLPPGNYLDEEVALGYEPMRGEFGVAAGHTSHGQAMLHPKQIPDELKPNAINAVLASNPGMAMIQGYVVDSEKYQPIPNAHLQLKELGTTATANSRGYYQLLFPFSPPPSPVSPEEKAPTATLVVGAPGYKTYTLNDIYLSSGAAVFPIELTPGVGAEEGDMPHGHGTGAANPGRSEVPRDRDIDRWFGSSEGKALIVSQTGQLSSEQAAPLSPITIPQYIIVGCGTDGCVKPRRGTSHYLCATWNTCATQTRYLLEDYVQRGLDKEWVAS
jgi:hypothetical protein